MKLRVIILLSCLLLSSRVSSRAEEKDHLPPRGSKKDVISFSFEKKPLIDIINELAVKKGVNIILPQNPAQLEELQKQTITYLPQNRTKIPVIEAWNLLHTFLELSGYGISTKKDTVFAIEKIGKPQEPGINRSILPIYANVPPEQLPDSQERIRYIYYLRNLKVPDPQDKDNPILRILKDMLTPNAPVIFEPKTNALIITDKANTISSVMHIIRELDNSGFKEAIQVIRLNNVPAQDVVRIFENLKAAAGGDAAAPFIRGAAGTESVGFFAEDTSIVADPRQNNLILMGRQAAVERIAEFVKDNVDMPPETGKSILHYYDLQYLDATEFAQILTKIVAPLAAVGPQATAQEVGGPERYFQGVVVMAEEVKVQDIKTTTEEITLEARGGFLPTGLGEQQTITGGNRLIIAARHDDWLRIKKLIAEIDRPQPYVILEVLVVDIRGINQKLISGTVRNRTVTNLPTEGFQVLSSNITDVNNVLTNKPVQLAQDLLRVTGAESNNDSVPSLLAPGSLLLSINDPNTPGIFGLLQILDTLLSSKILSHPYLITTNNQKATIASQDLRRVRGDAVPGAAGVITVQIVDLPATLQVQMIPRLSSLERLSLQVAVDINSFIDATSNTRLTRRVNTNANMQSGQILVIGGLTRTDQTDATAGTPILSKIPLIGNFFSRKRRATTRTNLAIFVSPTIVQPKLRGGLQAYTEDKIRKARRDTDDFVVFGDTKDPVTRLFFQNDLPTDVVLRNYLSDVDNPPDAELIRTAKEKQRELKRPKKLPKPPKKEPPQPGPVLPLPA